MQKNELLRKEDNIVRILAEAGEEVLYIQCKGTKAPMPEWCMASKFKEYRPCTEDELLELHGVKIVQEEKLEAKERNSARGRYAVIVPVLLCMEDESAITRTAKEHGVTKQTVRNYLKMYLTYNSVSALVRKHRTAKEKPLSDDEKNIRWAINKYYY